MPGLVLAAVKVPPSIVTRGVPPAKQSLVDRMKPYLSVRPVRMMDVHPKARQLLVTQRPKDGTVAQLHLLDKPEGTLRVLTQGANPVRSAQFHPGHGRTAVFARDEGGSERYQLFHLDIATGKSTRITDGKNRHTGARWSPSGAQVAYFSPKRNGRDNDLYVADPLKPGSERLLTRLNGGGWWLSDWSPDGQLLLLIEYLSINHTRLHFVDAKTGVRSQFTPALRTPISYRNARFDPRMRFVYYTTDEDSDFHVLVRFDLQTGEQKRFMERILWDVEAFEISPDGTRLAFSHNVQGASHLKLIDPLTGELLEQQATMRKDLPAGEVLRSMHWADAQELLMEVEFARSPGHVVGLDFEARKQVPWVESDLGELTMDQLSIPLTQVLTSSDGTKYDVRAYVPNRGRNGKFVPDLHNLKPAPCLILFHGGPESQFRPRFMGWYNYLIHEERIVLVCPNVRGSAGYGKKFLRADNGAERRKVILDVEHLRNTLNNLAAYDGNRIGVMGGSYGGFMALHSMVKLNSFVKCGVDVVGISNFNTFLKNTSDYRRDLRRAEYGDERDPAMHKVLEDLSPLNHVEDITRPLLIVQGANDPRVPASESEQMEKALRARDIETWYLLAKDEGHGFRKQHNREYQYLVTAQFLRRHLLGKTEEE